MASAAATPPTTAGRGHSMRSIASTASCEPQKNAALGRNQLFFGARAADTARPSMMPTNAYQYSGPRYFIIENHSSVQQRRIGVGVELVAHANKPTGQQP